MKTQKRFLTALNPTKSKLNLVTNYGYNFIGILDSQDRKIITPDKIINNIPSRLNKYFEEDYTYWWFVNTYDTIEEAKIGYNERLDYLIRYAQESQIHPLKKQLAEENMSKHKFII